jgi:hypothetical protein
MTTGFPHKKPAKRAFIGLAGSPLAKEDDSVAPSPLLEPDVAAVVKEILTKAQRKYVSTERPIQRTEREPRLKGARKSRRRSYTDVKLSSGDRDPAFATNNGHSPERFQQWLFDSELGGTDPQSFAGEHKDAGAGTDEDISPLAEAAQAIGEKAYSVERLKRSRPRRNTPWWFPSKYRLLVLNRSKYVHATVCLDAAILWHYYIENRSDAEIFQDLKDQLRTEILGRSRWTSSINALKNRRLRLVSEGDALFGPDPDAKPAPAAGEVVQGPPSEIDRLQMIIRGDFEATKPDWPRERCIQNAQEKLDKLLKGQEPSEPETSEEPVSVASHSIQGR